MHLIWCQHRPRPSEEAVDRRLQLKGSYEGGVRPLQDQQQRQAIDQANAALIRDWQKAKVGWNPAGQSRSPWPGTSDASSGSGMHRSASRGFCTPTFPAKCRPNNARYRMVAASGAVRSALINAGLPALTAKVVYPGVRNQLFGISQVGMPPPLIPDGSQQRPLKVCFAGLMMSSKGPHTLIQALIQLKQQGINIQASLAGDSFQSGYREHLEE